MLHTQTDLRYGLVGNDKKEHRCISTACAKLSNINLNRMLINFFEVQNIHPESKRNFYIKISVKPI